MTTMQQLVSGQDNADVPVNENFETLSAVGIFGKRHDATAGLTWGYYGGVYNGNTIADGTVTLTDDADNYIVAERATGIVSTTEGSDALYADTDYAAIYKVTTASGAVTGVVDMRMDENGLLLGGGGGGGSGITALTGDVTASGTGSVAATIANDAVTYAKMQNVSATSRALGRKTAGAGDTEELTLSELLDFIGSAAQGDILYRGASAWARLGAGTSGHFLKTQGAGANPVWAAASGASTAGKHSIYVAAASMYPSVTGGCAPLARIASASAQPDLVTLDFDATTQEFAQFSIAMPKSWNEGTVTFQPIWSHDATTTNFGVVWELQGVAVSNDDQIPVSYGTSVSSTDTGGTTNDLYVGPESSAITIAGTPAVEDVVFFRIMRSPSDGSDTLAVDARLHGIRLNITTDADTDA